MELRRCGTHDLKLPALGIGSWAFGGGDYWGPCDQAQVDEMVRYAVDHGCNFFDTAELYYGGGSETSLGLAIKGMDRGKVLIASKISPSNTEPNKLAEHCEASLRRLQTDYLDLYMVHWPITPFHPAFYHRTDGDAFCERSVCHADAFAARGKNPPHWGEQFWPGQVGRSARDRRRHRGQ